MNPADLNHLQDALLAALEPLGVTEIEITLKPRRDHVKVFVSCEAPIGRPAA